MRRTMRVPFWTGEDPGPRVLIEETDSRRQTAVAKILRDHGCTVLICAGPEAAGKPCPLVKFDYCDGVARADLVVHLMRQNSPMNRSVLEKIRARHGDTPVILEAPRPYVDSRPDDVEGCIVIFQPMTRRTLIAAVDAALGVRDTQL